MPGTKPKHLLTDEEANKAVKIDDFFVDLGMGVDEVRKNVEVGDQVTEGAQLVSFHRDEHEAED